MLFATITGEGDVRRDLSGGGDIAEEFDFVGIRGLGIWAAAPTASFGLSCNVSDGFIVDDILGGIPLSRYLECSTTVITENCGDYAANFTHEYFRRAAGEQVELVCEKMPNYPNPDEKTCSNPVPICSGSYSIHLRSALAVILLVFLRIFVYGDQNV
ncbi:uncharacterized protein CEXT_231621 [Caerostris extrusa]|uniref:Uncharacterized protein n=1 Tax=Caerostris extrusa TaxID=172846 RepID=A0AAV4SE89_CAEEX|nr:uncharacterized protein CEXT_231621 [Caerostris extrusa]